MIHEDIPWEQSENRLFDKGIYATMEAKHPEMCWDDLPFSFITRWLGPVHANNGLANTPFRSAGKECVAPLGRSKQATRDAARRPERGVPLLLKID